MSDNDFSGIIDELNQMNSSELAEQTKEIRKMITSLSGNNKSIPINDDMTINLSKFEISKNKNNQLYLKSSGDFIYIFGPMRLDIDLNLFLTEHNDKAIMLISACYVNCSKFNAKFDKMKKNSFSNTKINKVKINNSNDINSNIVGFSNILENLAKLSFFRDSFIMIEIFSLFSGCKIAIRSIRLRNSLTFPCQL